MDLIDKYLGEEDITKYIGRDRKKKQIYDKLEGKVKGEYLDTVKAYGDFYDKISNALKSIKMSKYNLSKTEDWRELFSDRKKRLNKAVPNTFSDKHIKKLSDEKASLAGWGNFSFQTEMDKWDYLTAVAMKINKYDDPDDHKLWFKK